MCSLPSLALAASTSTLPIVSLLGSGKNPCTSFPPLGLLRMALLEAKATIPAGGVKIKIQSGPLSQDPCSSRDLSTLSKSRIQGLIGSDLKSLPALVMAEIKEQNVLCIGSRNKASKAMVTWIHVFCAAISGARAEHVLKRPTCIRDYLLELTGSSNVLMPSMWFSTPQDAMTLRTALTF